MSSAWGEVAQVWAVVYENGMSLTTANEQTAESLAQAERQRGRRVTVRRLDDVETHPRSEEAAARRADGLPEPELIRPAADVMRPGPISEPEPASAPGPEQVVEQVEALEPVQAAESASVPESASEASSPEPVREPERARERTLTRRRRLPLYALAAAVIVVAAAVVDHSGVLPRLGANTSPSPAHVSRSSPPPQLLLPPLEQPPVMHFGNAARPTRSPASARRPQSATTESFGR